MRGEGGGRPSLAMKRVDQVRRYTVIATGETCVWRASVSRYKWHATVDRVNAVCSAMVMVGEGNPFPNADDRSNHPATCENCAELVRKHKL